MESLQETFLKLISKPDLSSFKNVLFVGPHPDDIEFGCGALISKLKENGATIHFVIVTDGAAYDLSGSMTEEEIRVMREKECKDSCAFLGIDTIDFLGFEDGGCFKASDVSLKLAPYLLKYLPDAIFAPDPNLRSECHHDHLETGKAIKDAVNMCHFPVSLKRHGIDPSIYNKYLGDTHIVFYFTDEPNTFVSVSRKNIEDKVTALFMHKSQMQGEAALLVKYFEFKAYKDGMANGVELAETYQVLVPIVQHVYSEGLNY